jgi:hypothetical protein
VVTNLAIVTPGIGKRIVLCGLVAIEAEPGAFSYKMTADKGLVTLPMRRTLNPGLPNNPGFGLLGWLSLIGHPRYAAGESESVNLTHPSLRNTGSARDEAPTLS